MVASKNSGQMDSGLIGKDLPYMTHEELVDFIGSTDIDLSPQEVEYLHIKRRRKSLELMKKGKDNQTFKPDPLLRKLNCENNVPYKVMLLGDETYSGKTEIFQLFSLTDVIQQAPRILKTDELPPCDIQTKVIELQSSEDHTKANYGLELWLPDGYESFTSLRPLYYPSTDIFVIVFSITEPDSFTYVQKMIIPEIKKFQSQNPKWKDVPMLLVGNYAEARNNENFEGTLVPSQEAVNLAQDNGMSKYIEIFSDNLFHIHEIFHQAIVAVHQTHLNNNMSPQEREEQAFKEGKFFKSLLRVVTPHCNFAQLDRTFELSAQPNITYYYTLDGTTPTKSSKKYTGPIVLRKPYPKVIKSIGIGKCKYQSEVASFPVPEESEAPNGYFDPITKAFHIQRKPDTIYFVTMDGTDPTTNSQVYQAPGIMFDASGRSNGAFENIKSAASSQKIFRAPGPSMQVPEKIKVIAIEEGKFSSAIKTFIPYDMLPAPNATFKDGYLKIDTIPGVQYRYTIDGTTPTFDSEEYSNVDGIYISSEVDISLIKVAAFPKLYFPSVVKEVRHQRTRSPKKTKQIRLNRATMKRSELTGSPASARRHREPSNYASATLSSSRRRSITQKSLSKRTSLNNSLNVSLNNSGSSPVRASPQVRPQRGIRTTMTSKEQQTSIRRKAAVVASRGSPQRQPKPHSFQVDTILNDTINSQIEDDEYGDEYGDEPSTVATGPASSTHESSACVVSCKAEGTNVEFNFEKPVLVTQVIIKTPGEGKGPCGFQCFMMDDDQSIIKSMGKGKLEDRFGEQLMPIEEEFHNEACKNLLCKFDMQKGQSTFKILDMKIDCKVA